MELSTKLYHIRALGRGGGARATLALQAPASPASLPGLLRSTVRRPRTLASGGSPAT